jgi:predicted phosphodiesterase
MKKVILIFFIVVSACASKAASRDLPRFAVISDIHLENNVGDSAKVKVPRALKNIFSKGRIDALFVVGDLTQGGRAEQYDLVKNIFDDRANVPEGVPVYFMMGNHENFIDIGNHRNLIAAKAPVLFQDKMKQPLYQYMEIKGFPFIVLSQVGVHSDYRNAEEAKAFLSEKMTLAARKFPGKPVFVFTHVPPLNTVYGTEPVYDGSSDVFLPILNGYPQAVVFSGHTHRILGDPRSIHQDKFTAVNDGSSAYCNVNPSEITAGNCPPGYENITEGIIVNVLENGNVEMERWNTYLNAEILPRWLLEAPFDGSRFTYKNRSGLPAPAFAENAKPTVSILGKSCKLTFPQASDNDMVHRYLIELIAGDSVIYAYTVFSQTYVNKQMPKELLVDFSIPENRTLRFEVTAIDSYGNVSVPVVSDNFTAMPYTPELPKADLLDISFGPNGKAVDISPLQNVITAGTTKPKTSLNSAYKRWIATFTGSSTCFYKVDYRDSQAVKKALANGFSVELLYKPGNADSAVPVGSRQDGGFSIQAFPFGSQFQIHVGGAYASAGKCDSIIAGKYYHVAATYDKPAGKVRIYVNGVKTGETDVCGYVGFPASGACWIAVGGNAHSGGYAELSLNGEIALLRLYGKALTYDEAELLYSMQEGKNKKHTKQNN